MIDETPLVAPIPFNQTIIISDSHVPDQPVMVSYEEHGAELDKLFAQQRESEQTANFLGMWMGGMLLADLAQDQFGVDAEESFEQDKRDFPRKGTD
jgi:hypothetical protein